MHMEGVLSLREMASATKGIGRLTTTKRRRRFERCKER